MSVGEILAYIWGLMSDTGYHVFNIFVSYADIFIFLIVAGLFIWLIGVLLGGD